MLRTWNGLGLEQSCSISIFFEIGGGKTCDILQTALPFATSNKINLFPGVVQIVLIRSLIYKLFQSVFLNDCLITQCQALVHVGYWCIVDPFCCKLFVNYC